MFSYIHLCCICIVSVWFVPKCQSLFTECCFAFCCRERSIDSHAVRRWQTMVDLCSYVHRLWVLLATMCVHGGTSLPFWCLFYEGPRRMYKAMQRKCGCGGTDVFDDQSTDGAEAGCCESLCCPRSLRVHMVFSQGAIFPTDNNSTRGTDGCFFFSKRAISMAGNVFLDLSRNGLLAFCSWGAFCRVLTMSHGAVDVALQTPCCRDKSHSTAPTFRQRTTTLSATRLCLPPLNCSI
eukprot:m.50396 g.50396  ORF g.50396 m.50396 type:complete len:236 (-) comp15374_c1_seq3:965-1672(-)